MCGGQFKVLLFITFLEDNVRRPASGLTFPIFSYTFLACPVSLYFPNFALYVLYFGKVDQINRNKLSGTDTNYFKPIQFVCH